MVYEETKENTAHGTKGRQEYPGAGSTTTAQTHTTYCYQMRKNIIANRQKNIS